MKVKCIHNTGKILLDYPRRPLGTSQETQYEELEIGKQYLVMGIIMTNGYLAYLIDDRGLISACPAPLFEIIDNTIPYNWFFKSYSPDNSNFVNIEAVLGYHELVFDDGHFEKLIDMDEKAHLIYFKRKLDLEKKLSQSSDC